MANTKKLTIDISPNLHKKIVRTAKKLELSMSDFVRQTLNEKVRKKKS